MRGRQKQREIDRQTGRQKDRRTKRERQTMIEFIER